MGSALRVRHPRQDAPGLTEVGDQALFLQGNAACLVATHEGQHLVDGQVDCVEGPASSRTWLSCGYDSATASTES